MTNVVHTDVKYVKALVWKSGELLQQDMRNYKEWRLRMQEWLDYHGLWCIIEPVKPEEQGAENGEKVAVKDDATKVGRPKVRCMAALRESVVPELARRMQNLTEPREAWKMLTPHITAEDSERWGDKLMAIRITDFADHLKYLDALQILLNDMPLYNQGRKDWTEKWVVRCAVRGIRSDWDTWEEVIKFYVELDAKILEADDEHKEFEGYTLDFFHRKLCHQAKQWELRKEHQTAKGRQPG